MYRQLQHQKQSNKNNQCQQLNLNTMKTLVRIFITVAFAFALTRISAQQRLTLDDAVNLASENNKELQARKLEVEKTRQQKVVARSLFLPYVGVSAQANHFFKRTPFFGFGAEGNEDKIPYGRFGGEDQFSAGISAVQPLFNPVALPSYSKARLSERESELALDHEEVNTLSMVKQTYLQILVLQERISLQNESIRRNHRVLQDARSLYLQGKALRVDTLRAYTSVKNLEPGLLRLNAAVETSILQLKSLIGLDTVADIVLVDSLFLPEAGLIPEENDVYQAARDSNPEYKLLELREQIDAQQIDVASAARLPQLSLVGQYQLQSQTNNFEYGNAYFPSTSFVGIQFSVPLFNGFSTNAKVREARLSKQQTALRSNLAFEQLRATVHQGVANSHESLVRLKTTATVKETAQLSYDIIQYRYKNGISSRLELTDAELELTTAQSNYLEAVYDYLSSRIALSQIMGKVE
jgi:outer membrane protein TolC